MWMKIIGTVLIEIGAAGYGFWLAAQYGMRLRVLEQLRQMIFLLKGQILYANAPLGEAFETVGRRTEGALAELFLNSAKRIQLQQGESFAKIWREEVEKTFSIEKADRQMVVSLGEHLGFLDRQMQERTILLYLEQLDLKLEELRSHKQERCRLYRSLGVMGGLFVAILLI